MRDFPARVAVGSMGTSCVRAGSGLPRDHIMNSQKRHGLATGFCHVDAFDTDDNYERDEQGEVIEEISYVTLDLGAVEPTLVPSSSTYRLMVSPSIP